MKSLLAAALVFLALVLPVVQATAQTNATAFSNFETTRLVSPDGAFALFSVPFKQGVNDGPQLWFERIQDQRRTLLQSIASTVAALWSPDAKTFAVNNHGSSDSTEAFIYDAASLNRLDIGPRILAADPSAQKYNVGHAYFVVERWDDPEHVSVSFNGHTDEPPVVCFDLRYRVSRSGAVEKLSQSVADPCH